MPEAAEIGMTGIGVPRRSPTAAAYLATQRVDDGRVAGSAPTMATLDRGCAALSGGYGRSRIARGDCPDLICCSKKALDDSRLPIHIAFWHCTNPVS